MREKRNFWKRAFFSLLAFVMIVMAIAITIVVASITTEPEIITYEKQNLAPGQSFFTLTTTKASINSWITDELGKKQQEFNNIHYEVVLDDYIYLKGWLLVFSREVPFQMVFEPSVNEDGGLTLYEKEIRLGKLQLPGEIVLGLIQEQMEFPDWVTVIPNEHIIHVNVKEIGLEKNLQLSVNRFDLKNDQLELAVKR
ncbi:YpmS family protein [Bacillus salitolerans]|uniref:YpmS family protein n=1 Tax=Bacillus salitolerans TaxID=1437434 RepID=A0ABW4LVB6_9BACI